MIENNVYTDKRTDSVDTFPVETTTEPITTKASTTSPTSTKTTTESTETTEELEVVLVGDIDGRETATTCAREGFKAIYGWCYTKVRSRFCQTRLVNRNLSLTSSHMVSLRGLPLKSAINLARVSHFSAWRAFLMKIKRR